MKMNKLELGVTFKRCDECSRGDCNQCAALAKQTPQKPKMIAVKGFAPEVASELCCPNCCGPVTNYWVRGTKPNHCQFCGQALDWEGDPKQ